MEVQIYGNARRSLVVAAVAGFLAGGLAGYLVARKLGQQELDARVNEEVQAVRDHYAARARSDTAAEADKERSALGGVDDDSLIRRFQSLGFDKGAAAERAAMATRRPAGPVGRVLPRIETPGFGTGDQGNTGGGLPHPGEADDEDGDADGRDLLEGFPGTGTQEDDPSPWPSEEPGAGVGELPAVEDQPGVLPIMFITRTEFYDNEETGFEKLTITYYEGDGVLTDDKNVPIRNSATVVGGDYIDGFGTPDEPDIVYVRNHRLKIDFEIVRDLRGFSETILNYGRPQ